VVRATLGETAYLFNEQYVVKAAEKGLKFGWHQDSGFVGYTHRPYLSCWCAIDDVTVENGTVYLLPYSRAGTRELVEHVKD
jgi:ectoine hydroxylase-related dioxygenase (phytanoyl-CoA dioxygenase family)